MIFTNLLWSIKSFPFTWMITKINRGVWNQFWARSNQLLRVFDHKTIFHWLISNLRRIRQHGLLILLWSIRWRWNSRGGYSIVTILDRKSHQNKRPKFRRCESNSWSITWKLCSLRNSSRLIQSPKLSEIIQWR